MKTFLKHVDKRSRRKMTEFLENHFRYNTMNSWNRSTSYANNMKIHNLGLPSAIAGKLYDMCQVEEFYWPINELINAFAEETNYVWQAGFNGRSGGYLVLYQGYSKPSLYKSYCEACGQRNYKSVAESGARCGRCGEEARIDYVVPPLEIGTYPGKSTDQYEDFEGWDLSDLRSRVELIQRFDKLCDDIVSVAVETAQTKAVEEYKVMVPEKRARLIAV